METRSDRRWQQHCNALQAWYQTHQHAPKQHASDPHERTLAAWLRNQRHYYAHNKLPQHRVDALNKHCPQWQQRHHNNWHTTANHVKTWHDTYGSFPRTPRRDVTGATERKLGRWLATQRAHHTEGTIAPERLAWLNQHLPGWHTNPGRRGKGLSEEWLITAANYTEWVNRHGTQPRRRATDPEERRLANWYRHQQRQYRNGTLHPQRLLELRRRSTGLAIAGFAIRKT